MPKKNLTLEIVPAQPETIPNSEFRIANSDDTVVGKQLTDQYKLAVSGMREVLIFGCMLMQVENTLSNVDKVSARGKAMTGNGVKGGGLKGWLETYAPEISRATAYRFLGITKAISGEYQQIVGKQVAKQFALPDLVLAPADALPPDAQLKQGELFSYVAGTSQRSWLDVYAEKEKPEKKTPASGAGADLTPEQEFDATLKAMKSAVGELMDDLDRFTGHEKFQILNDAELDLALQILARAAKAISAWRTLPKGKRIATAVEKEIARWKQLK